MLTYSLGRTGSLTLYEELYRCIRQDILDGTISPGDRLPSKRSLAKNLSISTITVEHAYGMLLDEGYIYSIPKKRLFRRRSYPHHLQKEILQNGTGLPADRGTSVRF